ncbi:MAG: hypothetical protein ACLFO2_00465 [Candidatus Woesearchaeota archaeon]
MVCDSRGQISLQFNWIFILIIGAVILAFFLTVINNQEKRADAEEATELVKTVDNVFTAISSNPDTVETFRLSDADIRFDCEPGLSQYYIQGAGPVDTKHQALFVPATVEGKEVTMWTQTWHAPFPVMVITHLASDRVTFLFVNDTDTSIEEKLYEEMPDEFDKHLLTEAQLEGVSEAGYDRYVIITTDDDLDVPTGIEDKAHVRVITSGNGQYPTGEVTFKHDGTEEDGDYVTEPMLWGAIFTEDADTYDCTVAKARTRQRMLATIIKGRLDRLEEELEDTNCWTYLGSANDPLKKLAGGDPLKDMADAMRSVESTNELIKRGPRCPLIY